MTMNYKLIRTEHQSQIQDMVYNISDDVGYIDM